MLTIMLAFFIGTIIVFIIGSEMKKRGQESSPLNQQENWPVQPMRSNYSIELDDILGDDTDTSEDDPLEDVLMAHYEWIDNIKEFRCDICWYLDDTECSYRTKTEIEQHLITEHW